MPGYVLGQWALSRYDGVLRVATTRQPPWEATAPDGSPGSVAETSSMVVKLAERDGALVETGRVAGLGKGEQIRAVRYFGDIAAVVTFRQTDPLYLLDLSGEPRVVGELKVPGFSTYLHPLGNGLLMGLGQDATSTGQVSGMQVSVFDVSDLSHPVLRDRLRLGNGWSSPRWTTRAPSATTRTCGSRPSRSRRTTRAVAVRSAPAQLGVSVAEDGTLRLAGRLDTAAGGWPQRVLSDGMRVFAVTDTAVVAGDAGTMARTGELTLRRLSRRLRYRRGVPGDTSPGPDQVRAAELIAALCLATDLGTGLPFEHGLHSTLVAMRLAERLGVDAETASQTYYACLLFYVGCTADAEVVADLFDEGALATHFAPVMFGVAAETITGIMRALAPP